MMLGLCSAHADTQKHEATEAGLFISGYGNVAFLAAGVGLPLLLDGEGGNSNSMQAVDALTKTVLITEGLKLTLRERRPDSGNRDSFPSGHTSAAFALATVQSHYHPEQAPYWYAGATLIGASRVTTHRHYIHDVVAGAALGYFVGQSSLRHHTRFQIAPGVGNGEPLGIQLRLEF